MLHLVRATWRGSCFVFVTLTLACASCEGARPVHTDVSYDDRFGEATTMDIYEPGGVGPHPTVMLIHGGAWVTGSKDAYTEAAKRLARSGFVAATINYRLAPDGEYPKIMQDCLCALSYLRASASHYHVDQDRIAVWGYSAGGHLASLVGVAAEDDYHAPDCAWGRTGPPRSVIAGAGAHDLRGQDHFFTHAFFGAGPDEQPDRYARASPITHVRPGLPPFLFVHGTQDWFIEEEQAVVMRDALVAAGNEAHVYEVAGGGHVTQTTPDGNLVGGVSDQTTEGWLVVIDFLDRTLRKQ
ncbi:MAG: alpha/beta hydrolase [Labilithrix sp.]|nr:alpha/beta hydrolase [Labilithrix sp.]MCW5810918.1 alpha/beta hydrolase [Labilithrix sp.]